MKLMAGVEAWLEAAMQRRRLVVLSLMLSWQWGGWWLVVCCDGCYCSGSSPVSVYSSWVLPPGSHLPHTSHLSTSPSECQSPSPPQVPPTPRTSQLFNKTNIRKVPTVFVNRKPCGGGGFPNPSWTTPDVRPEIINTQNNFPPCVIIVVSHNLKSYNVEINNSPLFVS